LRVAVWFDDERSPVSAATLSVLENAGRQLAAAGIEVIRARPPGLDLDRLEELFELMFMADLVGHSGDEAFAGLLDALASGQDWMSRTHHRAATLTHREWLALEAERNGIRRSWSAFFEDVDVLLTPVVPTTALPHDHSEPVNDRRVVIDGVEHPWRPYLTRWCGAVGVAGLPAVSVPVGVDAAGLPVGIQVVGPMRGDRRTLRAAAAVERICGGFQIPGLVAD
jgi:amidase